MNNLIVEGDSGGGISIPTQPGSGTWTNTTPTTVPTSYSGTTSAKDDCGCGCGGSCGDDTKKKWWLLGVGVVLLGVIVYFLFFKK